MAMRRVSEIMPATLEDIEQRIKRGEESLARIDPEGLAMLRRRDEERAMERPQNQGRGRGKILRELREEQGITIEDAARALGVSGSSISSWELGARPIRICHLARLVEFYDVDEATVYRIVMGLES